MRRATTALALLLAAAAAACGGGDTAATSAAGGALGYFPKDAGFVALVSTDFESEQWERFDRRIFRRLGEGSFENVLEQALEREVGVSYEGDVKPLLGNDLVFGTLGEAGDLVPGEAGEFVAALEVADGDRAKSVLEKAGFERTAEEAVPSSTATRRASSLRWKGTSCSAPKRRRLFGGRSRFATVTRCWRSRTSMRSSSIFPAMR